MHARILERNTNKLKSAEQNGQKCQGNVKKWKRSKIFKWTDNMIENLVNSLHDFNNEMFEG